MTRNSKKRERTDNLQAKNSEKPNKKIKTTVDGEVGERDVTWREKAILSLVKIKSKPPPPPLSSSSSSAQLEPIPPPPPPPASVASAKSEEQYQLIENISRFVVKEEVLNNMVMEKHPTIGRYIIELDENADNEIKAKYYYFRILVRECYTQIYNDILENVYKCRSKKQENKNIFKNKINFVPQSNFLVQGNNCMGKTSLCYYLSYMFREDDCFDNYDIIVYSYQAENETQPCFVRYGENKDIKEKIISIKEMIKTIDERNKIIEEGKQGNEAIIAKLKEKIDVIKLKIEVINEKGEANVKMINAKKEIKNIRKEGKIDMDDIETMTNDLKIIDEADKKIRIAEKMIPIMNEKIEAINLMIEGNREILADNNASGVTKPAGEKIKTAEQMIAIMDKKIEPIKLMVEGIIEKIEANKKKESEEADYEKYIAQKIKAQKNKATNQEIDEIEKKIKETEKNIKSAKQKILEAEQKILEAEQKISEADQKIAALNVKIEAINLKIKATKLKIESDKEKLEANDMKEIREASEKMINFMDQKIGEEHTANNVIEITKVAGQIITSLNEKIEAINLKIKANKLKIESTKEKNEGNNIIEITEAADEMIETSEKMTEAINIKITAIKDKIEGNREKFDNINMKESEQKISEADQMIAALNEKIEAINLKIKATKLKIEGNREKLEANNMKEITEAADEMIGTSEKMIKAIELKIEGIDLKIEATKLKIEGNREKNDANNMSESEEAADQIINESDEKIRTAEQVIKTANENINEANKKIEALNEKIEAINLKIKATKLKIESTKEKLEANNIIEIAEPVDEKIKTAEKMIKAIELKIEGIDLKIEGIKLKIEGNREKIKANNMSESTEASEQIINEADEKIRTAEQVIEIINQKIKAIDLKIESNREILTNNNASESAGGKISEAEKKISEADQKIAALNEKIEAINLKIKATKLKIESNKEKLETINVRDNGINNDTKSLLEQSVKEYVEMIETANQVVGNAEKLIEVINLKIKANKHKIESNKEKIADNNIKESTKADGEKIEAANKTINEAEQYIKAMNNKIRLLNEKIEAINLQIEANKHKIESDKEKIEANNIIEITEAAGEKIKAEQKIKAADDNIKTANNTINEADQKIEELNKEIETGDKELKNLKVNNKENIDKVIDDDMNYANKEMAEAIEEKSKIKRTFYMLNNIPPRKRPTIVISDNRSINEDDFSEDDILIMISPPDAKNYKVFRNKRYPIQYFLLQLEGSELRKVLRLHVGNDDLYDLATKFGGHLMNSASYNSIDDLYNVNSKDIKLSVYIPENYNEDMFIYDTDKYNKIPTRLRFMSKDIEKCFLLKNFSDDDFRRVLFEAFNYTENGELFEALIHILLEEDYIFKCTEKMKNRNMVSKPDKIVVDGKYLSYNYILGNSIDFNEQYYVNFSKIKSFPGIDALMFSKDSMYGIQMTISSMHDTKNNTIYETHKDKIIAKLKDRYKNAVSISNTDEKDKEIKNIAKAVYNYGYIPESLKYYLIYKRIITEPINFNGITTRNGNTNSKLNDVLKEIFDYQKYSDINKCYSENLKYDIISALMRFIIEHRLSCDIDAQMLEYIKRIFLINEVETRKMDLLEYKSLVDGVKDIYNEFIDKPLNEKKSETETEAKGIEEEGKKEYTGNSNENNMEEEGDDETQIAIKRKNQDKNVENGESKKIRTSSAFPLTPVPTIPPVPPFSIPSVPVTPIPPVSPPSNVKAKGQDDDEVAVIVSLIEFNKKIREKIKNTHLLNDLNDYLVDISYYYYEKGNNVRDEDKYYEDIIKCISGELKANKEKVIDELRYCNPPFNVVFFTYGNEDVSSKPVDSSTDFRCYDTYIKNMNKTMEDIYKDWKDLKEKEKEGIIERRSKRLRFETVKIYYSNLLYIKQGIKKSDFELYFEKEDENNIPNANEKEKKENEEKNNKNESLIKDFNIVKLVKAEEEENEFIEDGITGNVDDTVYLNDVLSKQYIPSNITEEEEERNKVNSLRCLFDKKYCGKLPHIDTTNGVEVIRIYYSVFQYPMNIVYIRESYKKLWEFFENTLICKYYSYRKVDPSDEERLEKAKTYLNITDVKLKYPYVFLLRGNPGLGKSSFIIFLLCKLKEYSEKGYVILFYKSINNGKNVIFELKKDGLKVITEEDDSNMHVDVVITDSFNYNVKGKNRHHCLVVYISSPDQKNYSNYNDSEDTQCKEELYLDVFNEKEITEWIDYCLPPRLKKCITKHNLCERYGNIPRHIYYAAIYGEYYKRSYWNELYSKGINTAISRFGVVEFIRNYLLPCSNTEEKKTLDKTNFFDITLCHYIIIYLKLSEDKNGSSNMSQTELGFISNDVVDYLFNSLHHLSDNGDIKTIRDLFYKRNKPENNIRLHQFLFQALMWCKVNYSIRNLQIELVEICREKKIFFNENKSGIILIDDIVIENKFNGLFKSAIFNPNIPGVNVVLFMILENGDRIYLVNNCFIHISIHQKKSFHFNSATIKFINQCIIQLNKELDNLFTEFHFISIYPDSNHDIYSNNKSPTKCYLKSNVDEVISQQIEIHYYTSVIGYDNYYNSFNLTYEGKMRMPNGKKSI